MNHHIQIPIPLSIVLIDIKRFGLSFHSCAEIDLTIAMRRSEKSNSSLSSRATARHRFWCHLDKEEAMTWNDPLASSL